MSKRPKADRHRVVWLDRGWQPAFIGFCPSERAWHRLFKHLGIKEVLPYPDTDGRTTSFEDREGKLCIIVTIREDKSVPPLSVLGLIFHEMTHVWRFVRQNMGETEPAVEQEAYAMQVLTQQCVDAYEETRGRLLVRKIK